MHSIIHKFINQYLSVQNGKLWIGTTYASQLDTLNDTCVFIRPMEDLHSVAEIISHLTLWRQETILKIKTGIGSKTDDCEENWLDNSALQVLGWDRIRSAYDKSLEELIELLRSKNDDFLNEEYYDTDFKGNYQYSFIIEGMLHHDLYHLGQLGIIIKFLKKNNHC